MKVFLTTLPALLLSLYLTAQPATDILHYNFSIELNDQNDTVSGTVRITLITKNAGRSVTLDLQGIGKTGKGMKVLKTELPFSENGNDNMASGKFVHQQNKLTIESRQPFNAGDTLLLYIHYKGIPEDGFIISRNMYGRRTFFADNWPNRAHHWIPCKDEPGDKASFEFIVTAPGHYQVISNGIQVEETNLSDNKKRTHWREDIALPTKVMVIGVAEFAVQHAGFVNNCIPVSTWVFPENAENGFYDYSIGSGILSFFDQYIGPYPYRKLANVQSKTIYGGMENAGAIFYYENSVNGQQAEEGLFAHEIVHQWFGDMATEKSFAHLWLSEGFATYLTHIYLEAKYGSDSLAKRMQDDRLSVLSFVKDSKRSVVDSTANYMSLLNPNSYQKGSWVLHMLRRELGDSLFHATVRAYYAQYKGSNADTRDFQSVAERLSGKSLDTFFNQWLYRKENPSLHISWINNPKEKTVSITVEQTQATLFEIPVELLLINGLRNNESKTIRVSKRKETFIVPVSSPLLQLDADYKTSLLAEITVKAEK